MELTPNQRPKLTGATILVFRASTFLVAAPGSLAWAFDDKGASRLSLASDCGLTLKPDRLEF